MTPKEKAQELFNKYSIDFDSFSDFVSSEHAAKECAKIAIENEYKSNRELLFNLRSCHVIESEQVYLKRLQGLIDEEKEVLKELYLI